MGTATGSGTEMGGTAGKFTLQKRKTNQLSKTNKFYNNNNRQTDRAAAAFATSAAILFLISSNSLGIIQLDSLVLTL